LNALVEGIQPPKRRAPRDPRVDDPWPPSGWFQQAPRQVASGHDVFDALANVISNENVPEGGSSTQTPQSAPGGREQGDVELSATISDRQMLPWESQITQYERSGPPGVSYFRGQVSESLHVDCLLYRDEGGDLVGILNHYPADIRPFQLAHDMNIWVRPDRRRRGIASTLLLEAHFRWGPFPEDTEPKLTQSGVEFVGGLAKMYLGSEYDFSSVGWEAWHERRAHEREEPESDWRSLNWEVWHKRRDQTANGSSGSGVDREERDPSGEEGSAK
jgi:hypothetical protein